MNLIAQGRLKPGQRLPSERVLCQQFGVGRSSLREALRCLSMVGILNARVGEGTSVAKNDARFIEKSLEWSLMTEQRETEDLLKVRIALEGAVAADAAANAQPDDLLRLEHLLARMSECLKNQAQFAKLDLEFHVALAKASDNALLYSLLSTIRSHLVRGLEKVLPLPNAVPLSHKEHIAIYSAIKGRNSDLARMQMQVHLEAALDRYRLRAKK